MTELADVALGAGLVTAVAPFAQAHRIAQRRSSDDVSLTWLWLYASGCLVWISYGISIASIPLIATQTVAATGSAVAIATAIRWRRPTAGAAPEGPGGRRARPHRPAGRVEDVMLPSPDVISEEQVVEDARHRFTDGLASALPLIDHAGRATGVVHADDLAAAPPLDRASCLVGELADRDAALLAATDADPVEVLGREAVKRAGFAMVVDQRHRLVGIAWCPPPSEGEPPQSLPAATRPHATTPV